MATGKLMVAWTMSGGSVLGRMCRPMTRAVPGPERAGRHHEVAVAELEEARAGEPREDGQEGDADRDHA